ncbi:MAG: 1-acyl-sn-glycerol-3-phosphate acyltransferase [Bacillaceae bacterium]|nr:1-acyl-sn-glycerol-3-phosphate acyltransferase [Bacillaceae bacterium]
MYHFFRAVFYHLFRIIFRLDVVGASRVPKKGSVVLCANHISNLDPILLGIGVPHRQIRFMAKEELFKVPVVSYFVRNFGAFPVKRGMNDRRALKTALEVLKQGHVLGIFPEGTRSKTGELKKGLPGAALFALRTDALVIPVAIIGPYRLFGRLKIVYGEPLDLSEYKNQEKSGSQTVREATERIMESIQQLIEQHRT